MSAKIQETKVRDNRIDNMKAFLIICVVFGHLLEKMQGEQSRMLYLILYSFHMPAFIYTTGYFARVKPKQLASDILYPYVVYQVLYTMFQRYILHEEIQMQFGKPHWILWYLFSFFIWMLLLPIFEEKSRKRQFFHLLVTFLLALIIGFDTSVSYYMSISRTIVFLPFFLFGYYRIPQLVFQKISKIPVFIVGMLFVLFGIWYVSTHLTQLQRRWFYHSMPYFDSESSLYFRAGYFVVAVAWIFVLMIIIPKCKIPIVSICGKYTLSVYLLHGFLIEYAKNRSLFALVIKNNIGVALLTAIIICVVLGNPIVYRMLAFSFSGKFFKQFQLCKRSISDGRRNS